MKTINKIHYGNPVAIGDYVFFPSDLQNAIIYHNEEGLSAIINNHQKTVFVNRNISVDTATKLRLELLMALKGSSFDISEYNVEVYDLSNEYYLEARGTGIVNKEVWTD